MGIAPSAGRLLYHITHLNNIENIIQRGLQPRNRLAKTDFTDIANPAIIQKRTLCTEDLADYVLFHFYARNPFDYAVTHTYSANNLAIITISRPEINTENFRIIPSHPVGSESPRIFTYSEGLSQIDWETLDNEDRDYANNDTKKKCMAECITKQTITYHDFCYVYVYDENSKQKINHVDVNNVLTVQINPHMFCKTEERND